MGKINVLGVIVPDNENPYYARILRGIEVSAKKKGYSVAVVNTNEKGGSEREAIATLLGLRVAGILAVPIQLKNYDLVHRSVVFLSRYPTSSDTDDNDYIINDDYQGAYLATEYLVRKGYDPIIFFSGPRGFMPGIGRARGYRAALAENDVRFDSKCIFPCENSIKGGYEAFFSLTNSVHPRFGLLCCSDLIALGALSAIKESGGTIPGDVGLVGYDDIDMVSYTDPPLTTVKQARYRIGYLGAEKLIDKIENRIQIKEVVQIKLDPELVVRGSA